jgi:hypothetical protein
MITVNACAPGGIHVSISRHKPLQIWQSGHPRDTSVWQVAYLRSTLPPELHVNDSVLAFTMTQNNSSPWRVKILYCP